MVVQQTKHCGKTLQMSKQERHRAHLMRCLEGKKMTQKQVADELGICTRQVRRLWRHWKQHGDCSLISRKRGGTGNHNRQHDKEAFLQWYGELHPQGRYHPKHATEKFAQEHSILISKETARQCLISAGYWKSRPRKEPRIHQPRLRRPCRGELVQVDGTPYRWLGGREWTLIEYVDDATSQLLEAAFVPTESTQSYFMSLERYIRRHGLPVAIYSDSHSVFFAQPGADGHRCLTSFGQALKTLGIEHLRSSCPQARGRVERAHAIAQDRLAKELNNHLDISNMSEQEAMKAANDYLQHHWMEKRNQQFSVPAAGSRDAHRPNKLSDSDLELILAVQNQRKVDKNHLFSYGGKRYAVTQRGRVGAWRLKKQGVTIYQRYNGKMIFACDQSRLEVKVVDDAQPETGQAVSAKELNRELDNLLLKHTPVHRHSPPMSHPFKRRSYLIQAQKT